MIRRHFDVTTQKWHFSIVDVIDEFSNSKNAQNYWKVLKNRLKKGFRELVTKCNQLKMRARDGKLYKTDAADYETILQILEHVPQARAEVFKSYCEPILNPATLPDPSLIREGAESETLPHPNPLLDKERVLKAGEVAEAKLLVDAYQTPTHIYIEAFAAGVAPEDIHTYVSGTKVVITGRRERISNLAISNLQSNHNETMASENSMKIAKLRIVNYLREELLWTTFSREITLPCPVVEEFKLTEDAGLIIVELKKI